MRITILGTGTATPVLNRNASGLVMEAAGSLVLVDLGPGTLRRLCEAGIDYKDIDIILITHFHPDHVSDLTPLLFASNYAYGPFREDSFLLIGPTGLEQFYEALVKIYGHWIIPAGNRLIRKEMDSQAPDMFVSGELIIHSSPAAHSQPALSYRLEAEGSSVTVSGDTDVSDHLVELARGTDLLICECSMPEGSKIPGHLVPSEAGTMAEKARARKLILTHFYPPCDEFDVAEQASKTFSGQVIRGEDLMVINV
jgi:ribonuclease BN (tRNA processing enzyme)